MSNRDIVFTTETDGLVKHTVVSDKYIHLFPNMLEFSMRIDGASEHLSLLIDNGIDIKEHITKINGIDNKLIEEHGVVPEGAANLITTLLKDGDCLVSHNVDFHVKVLKAFYFRQGKRFPDISTKCLQTSLIEEVKVSFDEEDLSKGYKKPSLDHLKKHYNIPQQASKIDALYAVYTMTKEKLNEEKAVKPASF